MLLLIGVIVVQSEVYNKIAFIEAELPATTSTSTTTDTFRPRANAMGNRNYGSSGGQNWGSGSIIILTLIHYAFFTILFSGYNWGTGSIIILTINSIRLVVYVFNKFMHLILFYLKTSNASNVLFDKR